MSKVKKVMSQKIGRRINSAKFAQDYSKLLSITIIYKLPKIILLIDKLIQASRTKIVRLKYFVFEQFQIRSRRYFREKSSFKKIDNLS